MDAEKKEEVAPIALDDEVKWEFKWDQEADSEVHGPHTSKEMLDWQESGFFAKGVFVRKFGSGADFTDGKRIDFDLYIE